MERFRILWIWNENTTRFALKTHEFKSSACRRTEWKFFLSTGPKSNYNLTQIGFFLRFSLPRFFSGSPLEMTYSSWIISSGNGLRSSYKARFIHFELKFNSKTLNQKVGIFSLHKSSNFNLFWKFCNCWKKSQLNNRVLECPLLLMLLV